MKCGSPPTPSYIIGKFIYNTARALVRAGEEKNMRSGDALSHSAARHQSIIYTTSRKSVICIERVESVCEKGKNKNDAEEGKCSFYYQSSAEAPKGKLLPFGGERTVGNRQQKGVCTNMDLNMQNPWKYWETMILICESCGRWVRKLPNSLHMPYRINSKVSLCELCAVLIGFFAFSEIYNVKLFANLALAIL